MITHTATSGDTNYDGITIPNVFVNITDNDTVGTNITPASITTGEDGTTDTFTITLDSEPTDDVTIAITSTNTDEGTVSTDLVTLDATNWETGVSVTVTGVDDSFVDGDQAYSITTGDTESGDGNYDGLVVDDVSATNTDDDSVGVNVNPNTITTGEDGATDTFTITLSSEPTDNVTIAITSTNTDEGTVSTDLVTSMPPTGKPA